MPRITPAKAAALFFATWLGACQSEPTITFDPEVVSWLNSSGKPLTSVEPSAAHSDLTPLTAMVGSARLIGLGEATHGSHEFFTVKDRILRHLVEDAGVTGFAMEASMPEAFAIDTYVRTGVGNPAVLLSHLYFWTWNTQEVTNLIAWLRQWNQQHPTNQVGFYGFDMQYPGVAIDSVTSYVARALPSISATIAEDYSCMAEFRNDTKGISKLQYSKAPQGVQDDCRRGMDQAAKLLAERHVDLAGATSEREYQFAVQMARLVVQWEIMWRATYAAAIRDQMMAENIGWLLDREGTGGRLVLWAHDYHIGKTSGPTGGSMGVYLAERFGSDYLPVGFAFDSGGLNALEGSAGGAFGPLQAFTAPAAKIDSYEATMSATTAPNYYVDLRQATGAAADWLHVPRPLRAIGSVYFAYPATAHYATVQITSVYDVLVFIRTTTPSKLLPFQY
jgi:erythromycin esterase